MFSFCSHVNRQFQISGANALHATIAGNWGSHLRVVCVEKRISSAMIQTDVPILCIDIERFTDMDRVVAREVMGRLQKFAVDCGKFFSPVADPSLASFVKVGDVLLS